jgi:hypothetical protein
VTAYKTLVHHPFVAYVRDSIHPLLLQAATDLRAVPKEYSPREAWRAKNRAKQTPAARYLSFIMGRTFNLLRMFEQLERARYLLGRSPGALRSKTRGPNRSEWTQYHFFVFTATIPAVIDCCVLLTADTYGFGIPPRLCSFNLVTAHQWIAGSEVVKALKALSAGLQKDVERRHRLVHRGEEADIGELTDPEWLLDLNALTLIDGAREVTIDRRLLATAWRGTVQDLQSALGSTEAIVVEGTQRVLAALLPRLRSTARSLGPIVPHESGGATPTTR